ncbi:MAG: hypothetical protein LQ348_001233 [Seirophora lacunosa]|nr:MAG: hypothetical protein LQ348_001233 [Seirophora lacunosa]
MSADTTTSEKDTHANTFNRPFTFPDSSIHEGVTYPAPLRTRTTPSPHPTFKTHSSAHTTQTAGRPTTSPRARLPSHLTTSPISPPPTSSSLSPPPLNIRPPPPSRGLVSWEQRGIHHARTKSLRDSMRKSGESGQTSATERVKVAMQVPKGANISEWKEETRTPTPVTIVEEGPPEHGAGRGLQDEAANKEGPEGVKDDRPGVLRTAEVSDDKWRRGVGTSSIIPRAPAIVSNAAAEFNHLQIRAAPNAPNDYTPVPLDCPADRPSIRSAGELSAEETSWLDTRRNKTVDAMRDLFQRIAIPAFDAPAYITDHANNQSALPNIAIAASGGGWRALLNGAGAIAAFDSREESSTSPGHLGGLLQSSTYLAGLSGGGWLVGSLFNNNFTTVSALLNDPSNTVWRFENSVFQGPDRGSIQLVDSARYFDTISDQVRGKRDAGFARSLTDYWGRALSFQLINATDGGPGYTWSSIALADHFAQGDAPFPVLVADGRAPGESLISGNATVYEFNPYEFGSWDPTTFGFVPVEFLGSNFSNGLLASSEDCVRGFDNSGFIMGTSSSLFNQFLLNLNNTDIPNFARSFIANVLESIGQDNNDIADYSPNPFYGYNNLTSRNAQSSRLTLVDGGEDLQNIPLQPLIQPNRHVDVIFAVDSSADTSNSWPNGTALIATYERTLDPSGIANGTSFPYVPDTESFVNLGLNRRPTFFGCNSSNTSSVTPLVVYLPNSPYVFQSNISTFTPSYSIDTRNAIVQNGYDVVTMANGTVDPQWPVCVGCAILSRSLERTETDVPDACSQCFQRYCWDGTTNSTAAAPYEPALRDEAISGAVGKRKDVTIAAVVLAVSTVLLGSM